MQHIDLRHKKLGLTYTVTTQEEGDVYQTDPGDIYFLERDKNGQKPWLNLSCAEPVEKEEYKHHVFCDPTCKNGTVLQWLNTAFKRYTEEFKDKCRIFIVKDEKDFLEVDRYKDSNNVLEKNWVYAETLPPANIQEIARNKYNFTTDNIKIIDYAERKKLFAELEFTNDYEKYPELKELNAVLFQLSDFVGLDVSTIDKVFKNKTQHPIVLNFDCETMSTTPELLDRLFKSCEVVGLYLDVPDLPENSMDVLKRHHDKIFNQVKTVRVTYGDHEKNHRLWNLIFPLCNSEALETIEYFDLPSKSYPKLKRRKIRGSSSTIKHSQINTELKSNSLEQKQCKTLDLTIDQQLPLDTLAKILEEHPHLTSLTIDIGQVALEGKGGWDKSTFELPHLVHLKLVDDLTLDGRNDKDLRGGYDRIENNDFVFLKILQATRRLESLEMTDVNLRLDKSVSDKIQLSELRRVTLRNQFRTSFFSYLAFTTLFQSAKKLDSLDIYLEIGQPDQSIHYPAFPIRNLREISVTYAYLSPSVHHYTNELMQAPHLEKLKISKEDNEDEDEDQQVESSWFNHFFPASSTHLKEVELDKVNIDEKLLSRLQSLPELTELRLNDFKLSKEVTSKKFHFILLN